jgi:hypothetical protein
MGTEHKSEKKEGRVKKEGWVNVYHNSITEYTSNYHATKKIADKRATSARVACIPIEWEEEE